MPFVDYFKKLFGINDSYSQSKIPSNNQTLELDVVDRQTLDIQPYHEPSYNNLFAEIDPFVEQSFQQLENFMRNLPMFGFPFGFGPSGPFQPPDPHHDPSIPYRGPANPDSDTFPFHGFARIFGPGEFHRGIFGPTMENEMEQESLSPRDEVLKPSYRSSNQEFKDEDYDNLVKEKGPDAILDLLKRSEEAEQYNEKRLVPAPDMAPSMAPKSYSKFSSTKFSFVNGQSVQEQITRLPDGTYEKRVTTTAPNGETSTVISQHTGEEIMPQYPRGGFGGGLFGGGPGGFGGPSFW